MEHKKLTDQVQLKEMFHLNMSINLFTMRVAVRWNRLPGLVVEFLSPAIFKTCLDVMLSNLLLVNLL